MLFDYNIEHYNFNDLKKLFNVKEGEKMSSEEMDMRIESIRFSASQTTQDKSELVNVGNFLKVAKEKYRIYEKTEQIQYNNVYPITEELSMRMKDNKMLDRNSHAIIEHTPDIGIPMEFKYVNIHSSDRDLVSWPRASNFEIELPDALKDVRSVSLYDYNFNCFVFNFSTFYQNVTFHYTVTSEGEKKNVTIDSGYYSQTDLMNAIMEKMNEGRDEGKQFAYNISNPTKKLDITFHEAFEISFERERRTEKDQKEGIYDQEENWGLGYYLGFDKIGITALETSSSEEVSAVKYENIIIEEFGHSIMYANEFNGSENTEIIGEAIQKINETEDIKAFVVTYNDTDRALIAYVIFKTQFTTAKVNPGSNDDTPSHTCAQDTYVLQPYSVSMNLVLVTNGVSSEDINSSTHLGILNSPAIHTATASRVFNPFLDFNVYLEIDGFNHVMQTRKMSGMVNSYFSRIPLRTGLASDVGGFERAVISKERVSKVKVTLRFHDGTILDLQKQNFDFTLMFECKR